MCVCVWLYTKLNEKETGSTVEDDILVDEVDSPDVVDDFELGQDEVVEIKDNDANRQKLRRRSAHYKVCKLILILKPFESIKIAQL